MPVSEADKRFQKRHRQLGLCVWCSRKAELGKTYCAVCLKKMRERWMKRHPLYCGECGKLVTPEQRYGRAGIRFHRACAKKRFKLYPLKRKAS